MIGRPATLGNVGEFVAEQVFDIDPAPTKVQAGHDGWFRSGPLARRSVNVKTYSRFESILDVHPEPGACDVYLVMTGPTATARTDRRVLPWSVEQVFLFDSVALLEDLRDRGVKLGIATSVAKASWEAARIYPPREGAPLELTDGQVSALSLFSSSGGSG